MTGVVGLRRILALLLVQTVLLSIAGASALLLSVPYLDSAATPDRSETAIFFAAAVALLALLYIAWSILAEQVELLWTVNARVRLQKWMIPALVVAAISAPVGAVAALVLPAGGFGGAVLMAASVFCFAPPLAASALLSAAGVKRHAAVKDSLQTMKTVLDELQSAGGDDFERVRASLETESGMGSTSVRPSPQGFTFAGIASKPWHDRSGFPWVKAFEDAVDDIRAEAMNVLGEHVQRIDTYDYPGLDGQQWRAFKFASQHREHEDNLGVCPKTAELLKTIPGYPSFRDAMFSILEPGGVISPHHDMSNVYLTMHLPLVAAGNGFLEVGGLRRNWREGEAMIFDSSYQHRAVNDSDRARIVLLVDFLHPELTDAERKWLAAARC